MPPYTTQSRTRVAIVGAGSVISSIFVFEFTHLLTALVAWFWRLSSNNNWVTKTLLFVFNFATLVLLLMFIHSSLHRSSKKPQTSVEHGEYAHYRLQYPSWLIDETLNEQDNTYPVRRQRMQKALTGLLSGLTRDVLLTPIWYGSLSLPTPTIGPIRTDTLTISMPIG
jgi:hypothetical protein